MQDGEPSDNQINSIQKATFFILLFGHIIAVYQLINQLKLSRLNPKSKQIKLCLMSMYSLVALNLTLLATYIVYILYALQGGISEGETSPDTWPSPLLALLSSNYVFGYISLLFELLATLYRFYKSQGIGLSTSTKASDSIFTIGKNGAILSTVIAIPATIINTVLSVSDALHISLVVIQFACVSFQIGLDFYLNYKVSMTVLIK
jgi:hypothetical protein